MTAITARLDHSTTDTAFLRGLAIGVLTTLIFAIAFAAAVLFATWQPAPAQAPAVDAPPAQIVIDQDHPLPLPGGRGVY